MLGCVVIFSLSSFKGRTFPSHPYFSAQLGRGQLCLFNILKAYSVLDEEVGYCQGLSFVAGILMMHMSEQDAFDTLRFMMYSLHVRKQYRPDMQDLQVRTLYDKWPQSPSLVWDRRLERILQGFVFFFLGGGADGRGGSWLASGCKIEKFSVNSDDVNVIGYGATEILNIELKI